MTIMRLRPKVFIRKDGGQKDGGLPLLMEFNIRLCTLNAIK